MALCKLSLVHTRALYTVFGMMAVSRVPLVKRLKVRQLQSRYRVRVQPEAPASCIRACFMDQVPITQHCHVPCLLRLTQPRMHILCRPILCQQRLRGRLLPGCKPIACAVSITTLRSLKSRRGRHSLLSKLRRRAEDNNLAREFSASFKNKISHIKPIYFSRITSFSADLLPFIPVKTL